MRPSGPAWPVLLLLSVSACARPQAATDDSAARREVAESWERYMAAIRVVNADSIAATFTPDGILFEPGVAVRGRDSIRAYVAGFVGIRMDSVSATTDTIQVYGDHALLWGTFRESFTMPNQPPAHESGRFVTQWTRQASGPWLMDRFMVQPNPAPAPAAPATPAAAARPRR